MTGKLLHGPTLWLLMLMEATVAFLGASSLVAGPEPFVLLGPILVGLLLPLGYVAARFAPVLVADGRMRLLAGFLAGAIPRMLIAPFSASETATPFVNILGWVGASVLPGLVGLALWWRGSYLEETELTTEDARNEFALLGGALILMLTIFTAAISQEPLVRQGVVLVFALSGLGAVALARQDAAGWADATSARALAVVSVLVPLFGAVGLIVLLRPQIVQALGSILLLLLQVLANVLIFLLTPLFALLAQFFTGTRSRSDNLRGLQDLAALADQQRQATPDWLQWIISIAAGLGLLLGLAMLVWLVLVLIAPHVFRFQRSRLAPASVEAVGGAQDDARALLRGLGRWLSRIGRGGRDVTLRHGITDPVVNARAGYRSLLRWSRGAGLERGPAETPHQLLQRLQTQFPSGMPSFEQITAVYEAERYGGRRVSADELARLRAWLHALEQVRQEAEAQPPVAR